MRCHGVILSPAACIDAFREIKSRRSLAIAIYVQETTNKRPGFISRNFQAAGNYQGFHFYNTKFSVLLIIFPHFKRNFLHQF